MSSSTVAVTANPAANSPAVLALGARRRNVSVTEKRTSNIEMTSEGGGGGGVAEQVSSDGKISDKSKDLSALKMNKALIGATVSPRPRKKPVGKTPVEKPRWQTVTSVFLKNFFLLVILLGLVQLMSKLFNSGTKDGILPPHRVSEIEGRIGAIDSLVTKTTKMVQVQFDALDKKIDSEVGGVRRDLMRKVEEKGSILEDGLKKLEARTDGLHKSLSELEASKFLTKEDLQMFLDELKNSRGVEGSDEPVSVDEIRAIARDIVLKEIERHAADGLGMVDYALGSAGALVVSHSESLYPTSNVWLKTTRVNTHAQKMLQPSFGEPGQCFPLKGSTGFVEVRLRTEIVPEAITLEHVAKSVAYDVTSAPKDCRISGWFRDSDAIPSSTKDEKKFLLAEFTYDLDRSNNVQTFNVDSTNAAGFINMIRLDFLSNHGAPHTCIYRLRVHGHEADSLTVSPYEQ